MEVGLSNFTLEKELPPLGLWDIVFYPNEMLARGSGVAVSDNLH